MGVLKLKGMELVKNLETEEEFDVLRDFLLTDPKNVTHCINFWKGELPNNTNAEEVAEIEGIIKMLKNTLKLQARVTARIYSTTEESEVVEATEVKEVKSEKPVETKTEVKEVKEEKKETKPVETAEHKSTLRVVRDEEVVETDVNRILRVKYEKLIKNINIEALKLMVTNYMANPATINDAKEVATFILGEGLYQGKKAKKWDQKQIDKFLESCVTILPTTEKVETSDTTEAVHTAEEAPAADEDLYAKYACYLGDNGVTLSGIKTEVKFLINEGKVEEAIEIAAFLLGSGEYVDSKPEKWTELQIEEFITAIKNELKEKPMDLNPEGSTSASAEALKDESVNKDVLPEYETRIDKFYSELEDKILTDNLDEAAIKQYVFDTIKSRKVQNLEAFHNAESTTEELESMYVTFFVSFVATKFEERNLKGLDVKEEIVRLVKAAIDAKEKGLAKVISEVGKLYRKRGENVNIKEVRELVYAATEESFPEYYAELSKSMDIKRTETKSVEPKVEEKVTIVQDTVDFPVKYPEIWENVKDAKCLDDVYTMARELEKTQSFLIVSEMIIHLISSGKINDSDGKPVNWDISAIELWINAQFTNAETVAEAAAQNPTQDVETAKTELTSDKPASTELEQQENTASDKQTEVETSNTSPEIVNPTPEVASPEATSNEEVTATTTGTTEESSSSPEKTVEEAMQDSASSAQESTVEEASEITYPKGITIPEEDKDFKELYASKSEHFWQAFVNNIKRLTTEGKSKKEITHIMADKIKAIAQNNDCSQCHARNFRRTNITEMYKVVNKKADALGIEGWKIE